jgi:hypothetical protein
MDVGFFRHMESCEVFWHMESLGVTACYDTNLVERIAFNLILYSILHCGTDLGCLIDSLNEKSCSLVVNLKEGS